MKNLKEFSQLYDEVKNGNKEVYEQLKLLGVGLDTIINTSHTKETFASALIQSEDKAMFNDLWHHTAINNGQGYLGGVLIKLFLTDENNGTFKNLSSNESESLFQKAFEGGQPWAVQASYDSYSYCASMDGHLFGLPKELPTLHDVYNWAISYNDTPPENITNMISIANRETHFYLKDWQSSINNERPIIFDFITRNEDEIKDRIDYIENKYDDFNINNIIGSHSILTALIENNHIKAAIKLHEKGYLDISRSFTNEESQRVAEHANNLITRMINLNHNESNTNSAFAELLDKAYGEPIKKISEHIKADDIKNLSDYIKIIDNTKYSVHPDIDKGFLSTELNTLSSVKDQADFFMFNEMVRKDFNPKNNIPSLK